MAAQRQQLGGLEAMRRAGCGMARRGAYQGYAVLHLLRLGRGVEIGDGSGREPARPAHQSLRSRRTPQVVDQNVRADQKNPQWKDDETPVDIVAAEYDDQRQSITEKRNPPRRQFGVDRDG